jgi:hypothetical protein
MSVIHSLLQRLFHKRGGELTEWGVVSVDRFGAVVLVVVVASITVQTTENLCSNTDSLTDLELGDFVSDVGDSSDNLVSWANPFIAQWTPTASDGVDVGSTNTTVGDGESDIVRTLGLELEVSDREVLVVLGV